MEAHSSGPPGQTECPSPKYGPPGRADRQAQQRQLSLRTQYAVICGGRLRVIAPL